MTRLMMGVAVATVAFAGLAGEPPALHPIFRDGMVFAAGKPMRIYGSGRGAVKVTFRGRTYAAENAADGWRVTLPPAAPAGAETLAVDLGGRRTVLKDVRLGEVFLAAGQSNWRVTFAESTTDRTGWTDEPRLRCFTAPSVEGLPFSPKDGWVPFTAGKAPEWSALITLFGRERLAAGAAAFGAVGCYQDASVIESWNRPGTLYNEVFRQIGPFAFSGVVWYQGESNTGPDEAAGYPKLLGELVKTWRRDLEDPELKFMIVQIADLDCRNDADWHALQAAQVAAADALPDAVAVRSSDVCESANVHPREKSGLARRLSRTWDAIQTRGSLDLSSDVANPGGLKSFTVARRTMNRDFTVCGVRYRFPGEIDWNHNPTYNNYCEWPWQFARHYFLPDLAEYYRVTEDPAAFACFTNLVSGFIDRAPPPPAAGTSPYDTKSWRTLDTGLRASMWMASWPAFAKAPGMTDAFRRKFVRSLKDHIVRLRPCRTYNNWRVMELSGLVEIVLMFPELDPDGAILRGAEDEYRNILATQLHPDGFSFELSPGYHGILPKVFSALAERYRKAGRRPPEDLEKGLELAYELYPHIVRPDRCTPDVNDSGSGSIVPAMKTAARLFPDRDDFRWFATDGREGRAPDYLSYAFPNAGAVVFRDGWTTNAVWGYVDMGPYGYAHQHEDKLNFLLFAYGKEMLTEGGIYDYDTSEMRKYVLSTRGHNTVRIDGHDQFAGKTEGHWRYMTKDASGKPIVNKAVLAAKADLTFSTTPSRDFAEATFAHGYNAGGMRDESVTHTRAVEFVKDGGAPYFRVTDTLKASDEREHSYEQLWHLETCELKLGEKSFVADFGDGVTLEATFASANGRLVDLRGQKTPEYQGWLPIRPCGDHEHRPIHTPTLRGTFRGTVKIVVEFRPKAAGTGGGPRIRDPFVVVDGGRYLLVSSSSDKVSPETDRYGESRDEVTVRESRDLVSWSDPVTVLKLPKDFDSRALWSPEMHAYRGDWYLFVTVNYREKKEGRGDRGTWIFKAKSPKGPFVPHSKGSITPEPWGALDGTLHVEDGHPYLVFCHEWVQVNPGTICAVRMTDDLTAAVGEPVRLFDAALGKKGGYVTDGPWLFTDKSGALQLLWSSFLPLSGNRYGVLQTTSKNGRLAGPWSDTKVLLDDDEGHCMLFTDLGGQLKLACHGPNSVLNERLRTVPCEITADGLRICRSKPSGLDRLALRYADMVAARTPTNEVAAWSASMRTDGSWTDVDYSSKVRASWPTALHLRRLLAMAAVARVTGNDKTLAAAHTALGYWCKKHFDNPNWWWPTIGVPLYLGNVSLLMDASLTEAERREVISIMTVDGDSYMTGQNFAWMAENRLRRGLLARDGQIVRKALADMLSVVRLGEKEGIRPDWCFHQHGAQPQFGNYGLSFLCDQARLSVILAGTEFAYPTEKLELVRRLASEGYAWITWKGMMDISAMGRQLDCGYQAEKASRIALAFEDLKRSGWTPPSPPVGFRYFNCSAYAVFRTSDWMASVRASTPKIIGTETDINEDNVKGMCMADGALMVYVTGREYDGALPLWDDWRMVPGVTGYLGKPVTRGDSRNRADDIVASGDRERGTFEFTFSREGLTAHKKWTFDRNGVLCEGSGISAKDNRYAVATSVEQAMAAANAGVVYRRAEASCFRNGAIAYTVHAPPEAICFEVADRTGDYSSYMRAHAPTPISGKVFSLRILHGKCPKDASYRYRIDIGK